jgi:hypothetical protein
VIAAWMVWAGVGAAQPAFVDVVFSSGVLDGPQQGSLAAPRWDRAAFDLRLRNGLTVEAGDFRFQIELVRADGGQPIPGWSFDVSMEDVWLAPRSERRLHFERPLPDQREPLPATDVTYRVRLSSYRIRPPRLPIALEMLQSGAASDQRAALESFGPRLGERERRRAIRRIEATLTQLPGRPSARDALRLLLSLHALGRLDAADHVGWLLEQERRLDPTAWGRAVVDLAGRIIEASEPEEPRLQVLPRWARETSALLRVRAQDAVREAVSDAILQMGDPAVPDLLLALHRSRSEATRERAWKLLVAAGRPTVRAQLRLDDLDARVRVIESLGTLRLADAATPLAELVAQSEPRTRRAATRALRALGEDGIRALRSRLGRGNDQRVQETLTQILGDDPRSRARVQQWSRDARAERRASTEQELREALATLPPARAVSVLDRIYGEAPSIYFRFRDDVLDFYLGWSRRLVEDGNYDRAAQVAEDGLSVAPSEELEDLRARARYSLAQGYADIGRWDEVERWTDGEWPSAWHARRDEVRSARVTGLAKEALEQGDRARARALVDRAVNSGLTSGALRRLDGRLLVLENLPFLVGAGLGVLALLVGAAAFVQRRWERERMARLEASLDRASL